MEDKEPKSIEENLDMVNYIMLHRIYDMLTIMANKACRLFTIYLDYKLINLVKNLFAGVAMV